METTYSAIPKYPGSGSYRTYEEWKLLIAPSPSIQDLVLTVPMRNGNALNERNITEKNEVLTVPMRNGNCFRVLIWESKALERSYRTYEEWKPFQEHSMEPRWY